MAESMDRIFHGLQGTLVFMDDILIMGKDETELLGRMKKKVLKSIKRVQNCYKEK